jgi:methylmalonyl-CoA mutase
MDAVDVMAWMIWGLDAQWQMWQQNGLFGEEVLQSAVLQWSVGTEVLVDAAALRALRRLWGQWLGFRGVTEVPVWIDAKSNPLRYERWKPEDNLLRCTASGYAAALGAADGVEVMPHDLLTVGVSSAEAKRWARNVQHLLIEESHLQTTHDPLQGSRVVEALTQQFVDKAWVTFQALMERGRERPVDWLAERILAGRSHRQSEGMFRPSDAPALEGKGDGEVVWDELGRPMPWFLVDHLQSQER